MKTTVKQLKKLIKEDLAAQAPPDAPMGQWAWPKERNLPVDEPDTELEEELLNALKDAIRYTEKPLNSKYVSVLKDILEKHQYDQVILRPNVENLYRGMNIRNVDYLKQLGIDPSENIGTITKVLKFSPLNKSSCWSKSKEKAFDFSIRMFEPGNFGVVLIAPAQSNVDKFIDYETIYNLDKSLTHLKVEQEALGIGDITINKIVFISYDTLENDPTAYNNVLNTLL
jgi:hypothetical protein